MTQLATGTGTGEDVWRPWLAGRTWPALPLDPLTDVLVLSPHPDDAVLAVGGLLAVLGRTGVRPRVVWVSDGEASHPRSRAVDPLALPSRRRDESAAALSLLGVAPAEEHHLALPDGGIARFADVLGAALRPMLTPATTVLAPLSRDGDPDHDAVGAVASLLSASTGARLLRYPVVTWHWAGPDDQRVPWARAATVGLPAPVAAAKAAAVRALTSQVYPLGGAPEDAAALPPHVLARFLRGNELVFG